MVSVQETILWFLLLIYNHVHNHVSPICGLHSVLAFTVLQGL